jgi:hypothetical protein
MIFQSGMFFRLLVILVHQFSLVSCNCRRVLGLSPTSPATWAMVLPLPSWVRLTTDALNPSEYFIVTPSSVA